MAGLAWPVGDVLERLSPGEIDACLEALRAFGESLAGKVLAKALQEASRRELADVRATRTTSDPVRLAAMVEAQGRLDVLELLATEGLGLGGQLRRRLGEQSRKGPYAAPATT